MQKQSARLSLKLTDEQIKFLEYLSRKCKLNGGIRLSRSCILRCLIRMVNEFDEDFIDSEYEEKLFRFLLEEVCGKSY